MSSRAMGVARSFVGWAKALLRRVHHNCWTREWWARHRTRIRAPDGFAHPTISSGTLDCFVARAPRNDGLATVMPREPRACAASRTDAANTDAPGPSFEARRKCGEHLQDDSAVWSTLYPPPVSCSNPRTTTLQHQKT